jgi:hypothetical protein
MRATLALLALLLGGCTAHGRIGALPEIPPPTRRSTGVGCVEDDA